MQAGHLSRNTLRVGVFEFAAEKVGDVFGVVTTGGAVTMVSLGAAGGSAASLALVVARMLAGAASFILALDLVGGMYNQRRLPSRRRLDKRGCALSQRKRTRVFVCACGGAVQ